MPTGRPTKQTKQIVAKIAEALSYGLTDEEAADIAGINDLTLTRWRKQPEFCRSIKKATAVRLLFRLKRIDRGDEGWQGTAWCLERMCPTRFAKPEVQLSVNNSFTQNNLSISIAETEAKAIEAESRPIREKVEKMIEQYRPNSGNGNGHGP